MTSLCQGMHLTQTKETNTGDEKTGDERYNYQNDPENPWFQGCLSYEDFKHLPSWMTYDKVLHYKASNITNNLKIGGYQSGLA